MQQQHRNTRAGRSTRPFTVHLSADDLRALQAQRDRLAELAGDHVSLSGVACALIRRGLATAPAA